MRCWILMLVIGCGNEPAAVRTTRVPPEPVAMPDAVFWPEPVELSVHGDALCTPSSCWRIGDGWSDKPATLSVAEARAAVPPAPPLPRALAAKSVRQTSFAYRVGCALTDAREVWCWSDLARPRKVTVPANVEAIEVLDPLALCVHAGGEISCTPPIATTGFVYCHNERDECRLRPDLGVDKGPAFDPVEPLTRPLVVQRLPFAAKQLVRDDYQVFPIVPDLTESMYSDPHVGGCVLGAGGEVACFHSCEAATRGSYRVEMPPAVTLRSDLTTGYAVTATGELFTWPRVPDCTSGGVVTARRAALPAVAQLAPLLHYDGRKKFGTNVRCVALRDGSVRCWEPRDGTVGPLFDPASPPELAKPKR